MTDSFSKYYADFLDGIYDCVDRIVLNAYFRLAQGPGGFRTWWRQLYGNDDHLDDTHLMRMAGRLSRRVRAYAAAHHLPLIDCGTGERKHLIAEEYLPKDPNFVGVFLILVGRAPAPVWKVQRSKNGTLVNLQKKKPWPYVNHYSFHIMDPEWGHLIIKLCGHPPFGAQILLNGHEYVACQARRQHLTFTKEGNCFTRVSDAAHLAKVADTLSCSSETIGRLTQVCERWIYSTCLCFALDLAEQEKSGFRYIYSVYQSEYSRNLLFTIGHQMEQVFDGVIERTRDKLNIKTLKTIFGTKKRPSRCKHQRAPRMEAVVEKPAYNLTVFKIHFGKLTAKLYSKGEHVLRIEVIVHNTRALPCGRSLEKFTLILSHLLGILNRFLEVMHCVDVACIADNALDELPLPSTVGTSRVGGVDVNKPRMRAVLEATLALTVIPRGFTASEVSEKVREFTQAPYTSRQASYDLNKLRAKNLVVRPPRSRRYQTLPAGLQTITALLVLREKVIKPVLAGAGKIKRGPRPKFLNPLDNHYHLLQVEMRNLFQTLRITA